MSQPDWENRFRDAAFVAIWSRWQTARAMWRKAWWFVERGQGGSDPVYDPQPELIQDSEKRAEATEYQAARSAYLTELKRYPV
jgi:hypothetical protein